MGTSPCGGLARLDLNHRGDGAADIIIIASDANRIDPQAVEQLHATARLPGIARVVGLPDLHAGAGIAVGAAFWSPGHIHPHLVGSDIGCGMALWESDLPVRRFKPDAAEKRLHGLEGAIADAGAALAAAGLPAGLAETALGTIGGGNHFAEILRVEAVADAAGFAAHGLAADRIWLMVHSGSRGLGQAILDRHRTGDGLVAGSDAAAAYLAEHDAAMGWAVLNRAVIARRFAAKLGWGIERRLDICHNSVTPHRGGWLHRKGAAPADRGLVVIPGSRGDLSYLVRPRADGAEAALHSLAHGAGRKWSRNQAHARLSERMTVASLQRTGLGGRVICEDRRLIFEEAPEAYKNIHRVVADLVEAGLIDILATLRPLISYKTRAA